MTNEEILNEIKWWVEVEGASSFWNDLKQAQPETYQALLYAAQDATAKELETIKNDCIS